LLLFCVTLGLNIVGRWIVSRLHEEYE
jgi:hypothetical protein